MLQRASTQEKKEFQLRLEDAQEKLDSIKQDCASTLTIKEKFFTEQNVDLKKQIDTLEDKLRESELKQQIELREKLVRIAELEGDSQEQKRDFNMQIKEVKTQRETLFAENSSLKKQIDTLKKETDENSFVHNNNAVHQKSVK